MEKQIYHIRLNEDGHFAELVSGDPSGRYPSHVTLLPVAEPFCDVILKGFSRPSNKEQYFTVVDWVIAETYYGAADELRWEETRNERDRLLSACDWTQMPDSPLSETDRDAWAAYRQALRDIPNGFATPAQVVWPTHTAMEV